jgi:ABC-2 type transport system permease protein
VKLIRARAIALRQFYLIRGSPTRILPMGWVLIDIVLWGFITKYLNTFAGSSFSFVPQFLGPILLWDFLLRAMQGFAVAFLEDVWSRNFLNLFASPISIPEYLSGLVVTAVATSSVGLVAMILLAALAFGFSLASVGALAAPFVLVLFLFGVSLGIAAAAMVLRLGPAGEWLVWPIPAIIGPFAGVFYPVATLPWWMHPVSKILPASYVFETVRAIVAGRAPVMGDVIMAIGLALIWLLAACGLFTWVFRAAVRTGLIARYSAETVN